MSLGLLILLSDFWLNGRPQRSLARWPSANGRPNYTRVCVWVSVCVDAEFYWCSIFTISTPLLVLFLASIELEVKPRFITFKSITAILPSSNQCPLLPLWSAKITSTEFTCDYMWYLIYSRCCIRISPNWRLRVDWCCRISAWNQPPLRLIKRILHESVMERERERVKKKKYQYLM